MIKLIQIDWNKLVMNAFPVVKTHFWVIFILLISLIFSLLPVMIGAAVEASKSNTELLKVFQKMLVEEVMFIYCASYIAPLVILTFTMTFKKSENKYFLYPLALIGSIYVLILGALMYSGVIARNLYSLGATSGVNQLPTLADYSILFVTLFVWYYCMFKENYNPNDAMDNYEKVKAESFSKFDGVAKQ